jgi:chemotaxis protein histidine kinase CheA
MLEDMVSAKFDTNRETMLRELLRENLESLMLTVEKIGYAFDLLSDKEVAKEDLLEVKRLVHSLKGNLMLIGLEDDAALAIRLEELIFSHAELSGEGEVFLSKTTINEWYQLLNEIEFSLKGYMF